MALSFSSRAGPTPASRERASPGTDALRDDLVGRMLECGSLHLDDSRLAEIFAREVLGLLVNKGLLSPDGMGGTDPQLAAFRAHPSAHPPAGSQAGSSLRIEDVEVRIAAPQAGEPRAASGPLNRLLSEYWAPRSG